MHYHNYKISGENRDGILEICTECKHKLITRKDRKGKSDNVAFLKEHQRDTAQPFGATDKLYKRFYGKPKTHRGKEIRHYG